VREQRLRPKLGAHEGVILFSVSGQKFAIAAGAVNEIRSCEGIHEFNMGGISGHVDKLRYTLERNGTTYLVVDAARHFHLSPLTPGRVLILRNSGAAVLVDSTDRMVDIFTLHALPRAFTGEERLWYRGLAVIEGEVVPVVNAAAFLSKAEQEVVRRGLESLQGAATP
jgi:chemotaxis signal transduction protein